MQKLDQRPDPDKLLSKLHAEEQRQSRARLKIFFGYAPGVGKTFTMLKSAQRLRDEGLKVVVGCVETHGRADTAELLAGLDVLPMREINYRGTCIPEFDLDLALARKPAVLLLDELAHTNAPGCRHPKRWHDVIELLDAGIDVHTTLNVQHIESLNDVIQQITHVRVRETVPDSILERADEIELIDLPPDELLQRLHDGKVYIPLVVQRAVEHFFRRGNLLALRELALRRTAERVDADVRAYREENDITTTWAAAERILVCVGPSPSSAQLIRGARRMAVGLRAPWVAVYADAPDAFPMTQADRDRLTMHLRLAESLGAEVARLTGHRVAEEILAYARTHNVTRIVTGKPTHRRWRDLFKGSLIDDLVRGSGEIEVHFIAGALDASPQQQQQRPKQAKLGKWRDHGLTLVYFVVSTALALSVRSYLSLPDVVTLYLLVIMLVAFRHGRWPSVMVSALCVAATDYFFVPPYFTFNIESTRYLLTFAMMFGVGIAISSLVSRIRRQEREAREREAQTGALYSLTRDLAGAQTESQVASIAAMRAADVFGAPAAILVVNVKNELVQVSSSTQAGKLGEQELGVASWAAEHGQPAGRGTSTLPGSAVTCVPMQAGPKVIGVLALRPKSADPLDIENRAFLETFVRQATLAVERAQLSEEAKVAALRTKTEQLANSLLSAVSHDLRTPLAVITGAGTALRDDPGKLAPPQRADLLDTICTESERMERLISNLLDMMRVESRGLSAKREWIPLEEVIGSALTRLDTRIGGREVRIRVPADLPLISADPVLLEHVFLNLIDNALKYTPTDTPIEVQASARDHEVIIDVADRGPGLPPGSEVSIFDKFWRGTHPGVGGVGLGLAICRGIVQVHDGTISAENRDGGGACFRIRLPIVAPPPNSMNFAEPTRVDNNPP